MQGDSYDAYLWEFWFVSVQNVVLKRLEHDFKHLRQNNEKQNRQKINESATKEREKSVDQVPFGAIPHPNDQNFDMIQDAQKIGPLICPTTQRLHFHHKYFDLETLLESA